VAEASNAEAVENQRLAREELHRAEVELGLRTIRSPLSGLIVERFLAPGEMVRQGPLLKVVQLHPLYVEAFVPLSWIGKITPGLSAEVTLDLGPHRSFRAQVDTVGQVVDGATSTFIVRLVVPNQDYQIPAGLPCTVHFSSK
jgi:multidrug resistance efflux pump